MKSFSKSRLIPGMRLALWLSLLVCQFSMTIFAKPVRMVRTQDIRVRSGMVGQSSTLLPDGKLLLIGGQSESTVVPTIAVQDQQTGITTALANGLLHARAWHSATLLPDGTILVFGGEDAAKNLVGTAEVFDPEKDQSRELVLNGVLVRTHHTATLLMNGTVVFAGGTDASGEFVPPVQSWDSRSSTVESFPTLMMTPRRDHTARLLANGTILFWGGTGKAGLALDYGELFDPASKSERQITNPESVNASSGVPLLEASLPANDATDVPLNSLIALRFSKDLAVQSVTTTTVTLSAGNVEVLAKVIPAEGGILAFLSPQSQLAPATTYTISLKGARDVSGNEIQSASISFTTAGTLDSAGANTDDDEKAPLDSSASRLSPLQASVGETALAGQVLRLNGKPLARVLLQIDNTKAYSDSTGRFLLRNVSPGHHVMVIDGTTANHAGVEYGIYEDGVDVQGGITNVLNYTIWMTQLDRKHEVRIPSPTNSEVIVTNPSLPGLELHIPANTVIKDRNGKVVTRISITSIPVTQPPFPLPRGVEVPIYFTIQPGAAYLVSADGSWTKGAQLWYPNWRHSSPGTQFDFWNYDADAKGWYVYGAGTVSKDARSIVPNAGVEIYEFTGAMVGVPSTAPQSGTPAGGSSTGGDPVDLSTGLFVYEKTDLTLPDVIPITLKRTYRPNDNQARPFGIGTTHPYEMFLVGDINPYTYQDLILPDGSRIHFYRTSTGTSFGDAVYAHTATATKWYGATITWQTSTFPLRGVGVFGWVLTTRDGTKYYFPEAEGQTNTALMALIAIQDRHGNLLRISRDSVGNIIQIVSPNGRFIDFQHDGSNRITQVQDNIGRTILYQYDAVGRIQQVTDAAGGLWKYTYDSNNNMLTVQDARGITYLTNEYDTGNHVKKQTQVDGSIYQFSWTFTNNTVNPTYSVSGSLPPGGSPAAITAFRACTTCGEGYQALVSQVDVTDPNGNIKRVQFGPTGYMTSTTYALGKPEQQTYTYAYYADNLLKSVTDQLGRVTSYNYDANANLTSVTRLSGTANAVTTSMTYESTFNQLSSVTDGLNHTTNYGYDTYGNLATITDPLQHQTTMTYDSEGRILSSTDALSNTTKFSYLVADLASITDPLSRTTMRVTDLVGRVTSVTDPSGQITKTAYDALNQISSITDALGNITSFTHDPNGNLLTVTDANQHTTTYTYDNMDRVQTRTDPLTRSQGYTYDGNSNVSTFTDRKGQVTTFAYDGLNRKTFAGFGTVAGTPTTYQSTINYTYDSGDRLTQAVDSVSGTITRGYDLLDRMTSETTPQGSIANTYDAANRRGTMTVTGQPQVTYTYDDANRLTQIAQGSNTVGFGYDNANRRSSLTLPNGIVVSYSYDNASELTALAYQLGANTLGNLTYAYDSAGRRTQVGGSFARTGLPNAVSPAIYDAANELTQWGASTLSYDNNGNLVSDGSSIYSWDAKNHLGSISGAVTASFQYDSFGRRTLRNNSGFLYDHANFVQELVNGNPTANLLTGGVDETFLRSDINGNWNFLSDSLGSRSALTDSRGTIQTQYTYEPFGNTTVFGTLASNSSEYTGRENDGTGLYFYRARYYNPLFGRFISEDPLGYSAGDLNFYAYVGNNPTGFTDPLGLDKDPGQDQDQDQHQDQDQDKDKGKDGPSRQHCVAVALGKEGISLGLDILGFIPGFTLGEGLARTLTDLGLGAASTVYSASQQNVPGALAGIVGIHVAAVAPFAKAAGWSFAKAVPFAGTLLNFAATGYDVGKAYGEYEQCMSGQ